MKPPEVQQMGHACCVQKLVFKILEYFLRRSGFKDYIKPLHT